MDAFLQIGVLTKPHGLAGEIKVFPTTDNVKRFKKLKECYIEVKNEKKPVHVVSCKFFKQMVILKFEEFKDINEIEKFKQCKLFVDREHAVKLEKDEYFAADMIGLSVTLEDGEVLGVLKEVLSLPVHDVYVLDGTNGKEILIPAIKQCVLDINMDERKMVVRPIKGLLD